MIMAASDDKEVVLTNRINLPQSDKEVLIITLNRPTKKNCFNTRLCNELASIFYNVANEIQSYAVSPIDNDDDDDDDDGTDQHQQKQKLAAVILTGAGKSFCAGADLSAPPNPLHQSSDLPHHLRFNPVYQMETVGVPIIAALKGHVITGGFELALACDILIGDSTTTFRDTHVKFGLAPCWGLSQKLGIRIGPGRAKIVSFTAQPVKAAKAYAWGLLDELVDVKVEDAKTDAVLDRAIQLADDIAQNNLLMVRRYKRAMVEGSRMEYQKGLQRERELGLSHYLEIVGDGSTFEGAKDYISNDRRPRMESKL